MVMGEETLHTELLVIGGGPGGYAAAFRAASLGLEVTLVTDEPQLGGVCLQRGCIPAKALLHVAQLLAETRQAAEWGIQFAQPDIDLDQLRSWKEDVVNQLGQGLGSLAQRHDVMVLEARATFTQANQVRLSGHTDIAKVAFDQVVIATGSHPVPLPNIPFEKNSRIQDAAAALNLPDIPETLLIVGGGYIGLEMGQVYAALGSQVTMVEMTDGLLPGLDRDLVRPLAQRAETLFAAVHLNSKVSQVTENEKDVTVRFEGETQGNEQRFERVLVAIGRQPNSAELGLENTRVECNEQGYIQVNEKQQTGEPAIFAIGDVVSEPMLAHKAMYEGKIAAEVIAGQAAAFDARCIPAVVYTHPEIAWCGLQEQEAETRGIDVGVGRFPWSAAGRAQTMGNAAGLTKIVFATETGRVLGAGIVGQGAAELIAEAALAIEMGAVAQDLALTIHPHPTLSETVAEAADAFLGQATHIFAQQ
ncbi:MAG: dihydrolipoyl dehydrogenase [Anaerolineales bacterium]|nr:dihydrolipoyl dehydrogenase [Anaerolineales bacterium]